MSVTVGGLIAALTTAAIHAGARSKAEVQFVVQTEFNAYLAEDVGRDHAEAINAEIVRAVDENDELPATGPNDPK